MKKARKPRILEKDFLKTVLAMAKAFGWRSAHFRVALMADGTWQTPCQGDAKGFPDLVLLRGEKMIVAELKADGGELRKEQIAWGLDFARAGVDYNVWTPQDMDEIERKLRGLDIKPLPIS